MGTWMTNCTEWNYVDVRDFEILRDIYNTEIKSIESNQAAILERIQYYGNEIKHKLGLDWPNFNSQQSKYILDLYDETINLGLTYFRQ
jgi:predicted nucleotidyltransferase